MERSSYRTSSDWLLAIGGATLTSWLISSPSHRQWWNFLSNISTIFWSSTICAKEAGFHLVLWMRKSFCTMIHDCSSTNFGDINNTFVSYMDHPPQVLDKNINIWIYLYRILCQNAKYVWVQVQVANWIFLEFTPLFQHHSMRMRV